MTKWESKEMELKFEFEDPMYVSKDIKLDQIILELKNKKIFRSRIHGRPIPIPLDGNGLYW